MAGVFLGTYLGTYLGSRVVGTPGSGSFSPLDLSPVAWWDGTDASTMNTAKAGGGSAPTSGTDIERWVDKVSSRPLVAYNTGAFLDPSYEGNAVRFAGNERLNDESGDAATWHSFLGAASESCTVILSFTPTQTASFAAPFTTSASTDPVYEILQRGDMRVRSGNSSDSAVFGTVSGGSRSIVVAANTWAGSSGNYYHRHNATVVENANAAAAGTPTEGIKVGGRDDLTFDGDCDIHHIILLDRQITSDEADQVVTWLEANS